MPAVSVSLFVLLLALPACAQTSTPAGEPSTVTVGGEGLVQAVPDRAWITVGTESRAASAREAQQRNADLMTPVLAKLKGAGLTADAIRTIGYDVQQEFDFVSGRRVSRGYVARNTVEIRVDAVDRVGELMEIAGSSGATSLGGVRFDVKERAKLEREAVRLAVVDARGKAEAAATGAGRVIDRILRIEERGAGTPPPMPLLRDAAGAAQAPPISEGLIEIRAAVSLTATVK
jgi:uncharacterized protein